MYYRSQPVSVHVLWIESPSKENLYLVIGRQRAILIDAGLGVGHLRAFVENLTSLPLTVLLTHGHIDHAPGATEFGKVYLNSADQALYRSQCSLADRQGYLKGNLRDRYEELTAGSFVEADPNKDFAELTDGMIFDLGEVHVQAVAFPGHTAGSTAFLVEEDRLLITGDCCNNFTFLFGPEAAPVEAYRETVVQVRGRLTGRYDRIFVSHHGPELPVTLLDEMIELCDQVLAGDTDDVPFSFMGMEATIAKKMDTTFRRSDGKAANLVYSKSKIHKALACTL